MNAARIILCNPGYGNNPYLRCVEVALAVNEKIRAAGRASCRIVVPLLYGEKQRRIIEEEFGKRDEIVIDRALGVIIAPLLYGDEPYERFLLRWMEGVDDISRDTQVYIQRTYKDVSMEIARVPLVETGIRPAYATGFARISTILERAAAEEAICVDRGLLANAAARFRSLEGRYDRYFLTEPGTFPTSAHDDATPPITTPPLAAAKLAAAPIPFRSVYVTASGIPGTEQFLAFAASLDMPVYSNDPERVPGSIGAPPHVVGNENIVVHAARAGWGAIWSSLLTATPLIVPPYNPSDDPEIFFNCRRVEELRLGMVHRGQPPEELLRQALALKPGIIAYREQLEQRFGALDGAEYTAERIVGNLLRKG